MPKPGQPIGDPTVAASTWTALPARTPMHIAPAAFLAAVVRTASAGHVVSVNSSLATGSLAQGLAHYITIFPTGLMIDPSFNELKDFVSTSFKGTLGAAMAYLRMLHEGYSWSGHYEESLQTSISSNIAQPDFVFTDALKLAIVEAKGTGSDLIAADDAAKGGYLKQVHTAADRALIGGSDPTEGYAFGTALNLKAGAFSLPVEMACVHQIFPTKIPSRGSSSGGFGSVIRGFQGPGNSQSVTAVKNLNYDKALLQAGLSRNAIPRILIGSPGDRRLHIGPSIADFRVGASVYTAAVAMPHGLLRRIFEDDLPDRLFPRQGSSTLQVEPGSVQGYTFVTFPDHVRVVIRQHDLSRPIGPVELSD